jgi:hypothetical protein
MAFRDKQFDDIAKEIESNRARQSDALKDSERASYSASLIFPRDVLRHYDRYTEVVRDINEILHPARDGNNKKNNVQDGANDILSSVEEYRMASKILREKVSALHGLIDISTDEMRQYIASQRIYKGAEF